MYPPAREGMEERTCPRQPDTRVCERQIEGPRSDGEYPNIYGPNYIPRKVYDNDNGKFESSTASDNTFYGNVLTSSTSPARLTVSFPTAGPPEPYLTDFKAFHS